MPAMAKKRTPDTVARIGWEAMLRGAGKIVAGWATTAQSQPMKADKLVKIEYAGVMVGLAFGVAMGVMAESVGAGIGIGLAIGIAIGALSGPR